MPYLCCLPGCGNYLSPQGPISMLISHDDKQYQVNFDIDHDVKLDNASLQRLDELLPKEVEKIEFTVNHPLDDFRIEKIKLNLVRNNGIQALASLHICCENCKTCCDYPKLSDV